MSPDVTATERSSLLFLRLCNRCIVTLVKPTAHVCLSSAVTENPFNHLPFRFYFQMSVLLWDSFVSTLPVPALFSSFEV